MDLLEMYKSFCHNILKKMDRWGYNKASRAIASLLIEPLAVIKSAWRWNQVIMTGGARVDRAYLLIHGNHHNPSAWVEFSKGALNAALFTVHLPSGPITEVDVRLIEEKIEEIQKKVGDVPIDLVGHSRGAIVAFLAALQKGCFEFTEKGEIEFARHLFFKGEVSRLIGIAHPYSPNLLAALDPADQKKVFEIVAERDVLVLDQSHLPSHQKFHSKAGHVGVLYDKEAINWVLPDY